MEDQYPIIELKRSYILTGIIRHIVPSAICAKMSVFISKFTRIRTY